MTIAVWPADLPEWLLVEGFSLTLGEARLRTKPDTGPTKVRLLGAGAPVPVSAQILCEANEVARFNRFWVDDLNYGVEIFLKPDAMFDGLVLADENGNVLVDENDNPLLNESWWLAAFVSPPSQPARSGVLFNITLDLEIMP